MAPIKLPKLTKEQQKKAALGITIAATFLYIYWNFLLKPIQNKIAKEQTEVKRLEGEVATAKQQVVRLPQIEREFEALKVQMTSTEKQLPKNKDFAELLRLITHETIRFHLKLNNLTPGVLQDSNFYQSFPIQVVMNGRFHNVGRFLTAMGTKERVISAENLKVSLASASESDASVQASFTLTAYIAKG